MSWSSPPSFTDGSLLSATPLNTISQDLAYLYGLLNMPLAASCSLLNSTGLSSANNSWYFRYKTGLAYVHYHAYVRDNQCLQFQIMVNGTSVFNDTTTRSSGYTYSGSADISSLGLTSGNIYQLYVNATLGSLSTIRVDYFILSEASSL